MQTAKPLLRLERISKSYGAVVALHNSWDSQTAMRHAVTWEAIVRFLDANE